MNLELRLAKNDDLDGIYEVEKRSFTTPWHYESLLYDVCENSNSLYLVAVNEDTIVGFCGVHIVLDECHINNIAVLPKFRRKGAAKQLIKLLISSTGTLTKLYWLEVRQSNTAAKNLYQDFGFVPVAVRPGYYKDTGEDAVVMCRGLGETLKIQH